MPKRIWPLVLALLVAVAPGAASGGQDYAESRRVLIESIEDDVRATAAYIGRARLDDRVMAAMARVPRHEFVPERVRRYAYENRPLPIGYGQTISQPYIVALMTDLLALGEDSVVLEIGTGSAYQAAVLAELVARVYTIEIVEPLGGAARRRLARLGYDNVEVRIGDGYDGWAEHAPFDAIMVTAAASHVPPPLLGQLKPGGRLVIPVGDRFFTQQLILIEKRDDGALTTTQVLPVRFVPLVRAE
jgi:protein-L-isoaspartate(D-aspartate) O-methyltransferase